MQAGLETFNQQQCSPESCHSVTHARVLLFVKAAPFFAKKVTAAPRQDPENQPFCFTYLPAYARMPADASDVGLPDSRCGGAVRIAALLCR